MSKNINFFCLILGFLGVVSGCEGDKEQIKEVKVEPLLPSAGTFTQEQGNTDSIPADSTQEGLPTNELHKSLIGTFWRFEEFDLKFLDAKKVLVKGGVVNKLSPKGIEAEYKVYDDGIIEIMVLGMIKTGMWDGKKLVIDGLIGTKKE